MWEFVFEIVGGLILDLLPRPVRIGCLTVIGLFLAAILLWAWLR